MRECAFTIVAKNYIGLGQILGKSLKEHSPKVDFLIFVADEPAAGTPALPAEVVVARQAITGISPSQWRDMSFKYDLTEFCTAIKPFCFKHVLGLGYDKAYYFDPDIYVFSDIKPISEALDRHTMALTPQVLGIHPHYTGEHPEWAMNVNGIFNLGFCGISNNDEAQRLLSWWGERLIDQAFTDRSVGQFTDQKWMDWVPAFLGSRLCVLQSLGMNMAPWNYFERKLHRGPDGALRVMWRTNDMPAQDDPLVFVHFAGYDYAKLKQGIVARKRIEDLAEYDDLAVMNTIYRDAIVANAQMFDSFILQPYTYGTFNDGTPIAAFHRRLYHGLAPTPADPFATGKGTFHEMLRKRGMLIQENIDHASRRNIADMGRKKQALSLLYRMLYRLMGYKRYVMFLKSLYFYCRPEMHTFLIDKHSATNTERHD